MDNPLYLILCSVVVPSGDAMITRARIDPGLLDAVDDGVKAALRRNLIRSRDDLIAAERPGETADPDRDEWWIGDDAPDAFIRDREPVRLDWVAP